MTPGEVVGLLMGAFAALLGGAIFLGGAHKALQWSLIASTRTTPAADVESGRVEVAGAAERDGPLAQGPFSGAPALSGAWLVEELRRGKKGSDRWVVARQGRVGGPFRVRDASGSVRVDPEGMEWDAGDTWTAEGGAGRPAPEEVARFLRAQDPDADRLLQGNAPLRFREKLLAEGETVYALGVARRGPDGRVVLGRGRAGFPSLVSTMSEKGALRKARKTAIAALLFGGIFLVVGLYVAALSLGLA